MQIFEYDPAGNILKKPNNAGSGQMIFAYPPQGAGAKRPHAVSDISGVGAFEYDENGNLQKGGGRTITWTSFDMPSAIASVTGAGATFSYGPEYQRTRQLRLDQSYVVYAGAQEVDHRGDRLTVKTYWPHGIGVEIDGLPGKDTAELLWTHEDRLGSSMAMTDMAGGLAEVFGYDTWGKRRTATGTPENGTSTPDSLDGKLDNRGFTGHEMLDQLELVHMNGRVYDPMTARFLSADPILQDPMNGQSYNRYAYVMNNPTNLTDPTGFEADCEKRKSCEKEREQKEKEELRKFADGVCAGTKGTTCRAEVKGGVNQLVSDANNAKNPGANGVGQSYVSYVNLIPDNNGRVGTPVTVHPHEPTLLEKVEQGAGAVVDEGLRVLEGLPMGGPAIKFAGKAATVVNACCCFPAGTPVVTESGTLPIEHIRVGQLVYARDPNTGETKLKPVTQLMTTRAKPLYELVTQGISGSRESMEVTDNHPYWVKGKGWVDAVKLTPGMVLQSRDAGELTVVALEKVGREDVTYNLTVADFHTYFAGKQKAFVHNCSCGLEVKSLLKGSNLLMREAEKAGKSVQRSLDNLVDALKKGDLRKR